MINKQQFLQDAFLNELRKQLVPVSIYLVSGIKLQGKIDSFDQFSVFLKSSVVQMIYKHAIATIIPAQDHTWKGSEGSIISEERSLTEEDSILAEDSIAQ